MSCFVVFNSFQHQNTTKSYSDFSDPKGAWQDGNRHTPSDKVPWSDPLQDPSFDSFCDDVFGMSLGGAPGPKMGPHNNGTPHQVCILRESTF
jgi:hypothetical protein